MACALVYKAEEVSVTGLGHKRRNVAVEEGALSSKRGN